MRSCPVDLDILFMSQAQIVLSRTAFHFCQTPPHRAFRHRMLAACCSCCRSRVPCARPTLRQYIVSESMGSENEAMFEDIYEYYARGHAWKVAPGADESLRRLRDQGGQRGNFKSLCFLLFCPVREVLLVYIRVRSSTAR